MAASRQDSASASQEKADFSASNWLMRSSCSLAKNSFWLVRPVLGFCLPVSIAPFITHLLAAVHSLHDLTARLRLPGKVITPCPADIPVLTLRLPFPWPWPVSPPICHSCKTPASPWACLQIR